MNLLKRIFYLKGYAGKRRQNEALIYELLWSLLQTAGKSEKNTLRLKGEGEKLVAGLVITAIALVALSRSNQDELTTRLTKYLSKLLPRALRDNLIGDLREEYPAVKAIRGEYRAKAWFYHQLVSAVCRLLFVRTLSRLKGWVRQFTN